MENHIFAWADFGRGPCRGCRDYRCTFLLQRVHRNITALLRVIRRMDRKTADTTRSGYRPRTELAAWPEMPPDGSGDHG